MAVDDPEEGKFLGTSFGTGRVRRRLPSENLLNYKEIEQRRASRAMKGQEYMASANEVLETTQEGQNSKFKPEGVMGHPEQGQCNWPYGEIPNHFWCVNPQHVHSYVNGKAKRSKYCQLHHAKAYKKAVESAPRDYAMHNRSKTGGR